ncbi:hypothetical protein AAE478_008395 [Parahypoxylon ruwenzoriense]
MSEMHRPDIAAWRKRRTGALAYEACMWPAINLEDLSKTEPPSNAKLPGTEPPGRIRDSRYRDNSRSRAHIACLLVWTPPGLKSVVESKLFEAKDHLRALREDPAYFATDILEWKEHRQ